MPSPEYLERKKAYIKGYNKEHYKPITAMFRVDSEEELAMYKHIKSHSSTADYIKNLVKADMKKEG